MLNLRKLLLIIVCHALSCLPSVAEAGFNESLRAFQAKDYPAAASEARKAAEAGDPRGGYLLGVLYQNGLGVTTNFTEAVSWYETAAKGGVIGAFTKLAQAYAGGYGVRKDEEKAFAYARVASRLGDTEGSFFFYVLSTAGPLSYLTNGKPDEVKYQRLATRPVSERTLEIEARDALYHSAEKGYPIAYSTLALMLGATLGDGNRERMLANIAKNPTNQMPALQNYEKISRYLDKLGQSYVTPQLFIDAQASQMVAAMIQTCGPREKGTTPPTPPELTAISIAKPLSGATYLPSSVAGYEHAYLISGEWEENWTYRGCGRDATVRVKFVADGLGGASIVSKQSGKDILGL